MHRFYIFDCLIMQMQHFSLFSLVHETNDEYEYEFKSQSFNLNTRRESDKFSLAGYALFFSDE